MSDKSGSGNEVELGMENGGDVCASNGVVVANVLADRGVKGGLSSARDMCVSGGGGDVEQ
jgi:hypothetical protein